MFTGDQDIGCVFLPMRHMLNSLPLFSYSCAKTPALSASGLLCWQIRTNQLQGISNLLLPVCPSLLHSTANIPPLPICQSAWPH